MPGGGCLPRSLIAHTPPLLPRSPALVHENSARPLSPLPDGTPVWQALHPYGSLGAGRAASPDITAPLLCELQCGPDLREGSCVGGSKVRWPRGKEAGAYRQEWLVPLTVEVSTRNE